MAATGGRLARLDPGRAALRRAARVTIAACLAFYPLRYGLDDPTTAVYALFTTIALGALSDVQGAPATRTRTYLAALAAGALLITAGTLAAVDTLVAAAGMLVVGFVVAYAGIGGPRLVGVANGLQLFYILPCFPPFAPDTLDQRLLGLAAGGALVVAADRLLWPAPGPPPPGARLAVAADRVAGYADALRSVLHDPDRGSGPAPAARRDALAAVARLRLADIPLPERPLGPGVRDRSLLAAGAATRVTAARIADLADLLAESGRAPHPRTADLLGATADVFARLAAALRAGAPMPVATTDLDLALQRYGAERGRHLADGTRPATNLRAGLAAVAVGEEARLAALAAGGFLGAPPPDPASTPPALWFLQASRAELVRHRLRAHLTPRSVYLQNAVRLAARPGRRPGGRRRAGPLAWLLGAAGHAQPDAHLGVRRASRAAARLRRHRDRRVAGRRTAHRGRLGRRGVRLGAAPGDGAGLRRRPGVRHRRRAGRVHGRRRDAVRPAGPDGLAAGGGAARPTSWSAAWSGR